MNKSFFESRPDFATADKSLLWRFYIDLAERAICNAMARGLPLDNELIEAVATSRRCLHLGLDRGNKEEMDKANAIYINLLRNQDRTNSYILSIAWIAYCLIVNPETLFAKDVFDDSGAIASAGDELVITEADHRWFQDYSLTS